MTKQEAKQQIAKLIEKYQRLVDTRKVKSYNEAQTRNEFIEPLFEFLGWDMRNLENPNEVTTEETVSKGRVDLAFRLNHIPVMFLEAKALKVDLDEWKWAEQAINYSWNKSVTWAILSDFEGIKVFNAEIPPKSLSQNLFFELKWHEYLDRFDQLWLLSKESFEEKKLAEQAEKWGKLTKRKQVGEKLFEDLTTWRALLTKDFRKNNSNIDEDALDEGVQKVLDRLIFIRTAEDRKIEQNILLSLVREWESAGKKHNIFKRLNDGFRWFDDHYNSKLFSSHALENWKADDKVFETIIKGLYQTTDGYRYDFSAISTDVLGGIYEQYLGYVQEKAQKDDKKKSKRKSQGIYYTPKYVVEYLIEQTLGEVLKKAKAKDIPNIKILDPACGSGSFLISAYDKMLEAKTKLDKQTGLFDRFEILKNNIYGVDLDEQAIEIAQLNLLLRVLQQRTKLPTLSHNIRIGNSLVDGDMEKLQQYFDDVWREQKAFNWKQEFSEVFEHEGFSVIIGNPPYVFARGKNFDDSAKKYFYENYKLANYQLNTYLLFIERAYNLLQEGGYFGFIVPNTWLTIDTFAPLRKFLLEEVGSLQIINIYDKVFGDANVDTCLVIFKKGRRSKVTLGEFRDSKLKIVGKFSPDDFKDNNHIINISLAKDKDKMMILKKVAEKSKQLKDSATASTGLKAYQTGKGKPPQTEEIKNNRVFHSKNKEDENYIKYLEGRDVKRYALGWSGEYLSYGDWLAEPRKSVPFDGKRILVRQIPSQPPYAINAVFTEGKYLNDINSMVIFDFKVEPLFLLAVINSKLTTFWFANTFDKFQRKTFPQFKVKELAIFPIPEANEKEQAEITKLAELMLNLQKEAHEITSNTDKHARLKTEIEKLDEKIDRAIYKLYNLTDEEIATIEK
ncbi:N-6 DNA methylase [Patescibacteria group bacterium]|nr:N-6 DNA methylase [Patescibacteria group bacterium]